jgi:hypothetical protein
MQAQATSGPSEDDIYEEAVLRHILDWHPTILRMCDLVREINPDPGNFGQRDAVERAVRELVAVGLLYRQGECVLPTPAAVYMQEIEL